MLFEKAAPVAIGQHDIEQDKIVVSGLGIGNCIINSASVINGVTIQMHACTNRLCQVHIVFDQKELHTLFSLFSSRDSSVSASCVCLSQLSRLSDSCQMGGNHDDT
jgi:hypothetical protein